MLSLKNTDVVKYLDSVKRNQEYVIVSKLSSSKNIQYADNTRHSYRYMTMPSFRKDLDIETYINERIFSFSISLILNNIFTYVKYRKIIL